MDFPENDATNFARLMDPDRVLTVLNGIRLNLDLDTALLAAHCTPDETAAALKDEDFALRCKQIRAEQHFKDNFLFEDILKRNAMLGESRELRFKLERHYPEWSLKLPRSADIPEIPPFEVSDKE